MSTTPHLTSQVRHVVQAAVLAPSVHNTQPWRFVERSDGFDLHADPDRRLAVLDPEGRQLHLSCGAALLTARVAARALGLDAEVELLPDPAEPQLLARLHLRVGTAADDDELGLALAVLRRHTVRGAFDPQPLPDGLLEELRQAAEAEGAVLRSLDVEREQVDLAALLAAADTAEEDDPAYRAEISTWVHDAAYGDGIPPEAVTAEAGRSTSLKVRDFTLSASEPSPGDVPPAECAEVVVLSSTSDTPYGWLCAGQALGAVLLHAAAQGVQAQPLGQVTDLPSTRRQLAAALGLVGHPQLVLRLGRADAHAATPRRVVEDVLV